MNLSRKHPVALVGANGYSGLELARLLLQHPYAELKSSYVRSATHSMTEGSGKAWRLSDELIGQKAQEVASLPVSELFQNASRYQTIFLATPPEVSLELAHALRNKTSMNSGNSKTEAASTSQVPQIIDLSGAFRLPAEDFKKHYLPTSSSPAFSSIADYQPAHYGLIPWNPAPSLHLPKSSQKNSDKNSKQRFTAVISNPGCYATSCLMALIPLLKEGLIDPTQIVIDAKSGTTGAGRKGSTSLLFSEVEGECLPYKVGSHPHLPEIEFYLEQFSGIKTEIQFTTHLLPIRRGILSSLYLKRNPRLKSLSPSLSDAEFSERIQAAFQSAYSQSPLVLFGPLDENPKLISLKHVVGSARTHLSYQVKGNHVFVFSCIDNLLKGAASQAIENWNSINHWPTETGLNRTEVML